MADEARHKTSAIERNVSKLGLLTPLLSLCMVPSVSKTLTGDWWALKVMRLSGIGDVRLKTWKCGGVLKESRFFS